MPRGKKCYALYSERGCEFNPMKLWFHTPEIKCVTPPERLT